MKKVSFVIWYEANPEFAYNCIESIVRSTCSENVSIYAVRTSHVEGGKFDSKIRWLPRTTLLHAQGLTVSESFKRVFCFIEKNDKSNCIAFGTANFIANHEFINELNVSDCRFYLPYSNFFKKDAFNKIKTSQSMMTNNEGTPLLFVPSLFVTSAITNKIHNYYVLDYMIEKLIGSGLTGYYIPKCYCDYNATIDQFSIMKTATKSNDMRVLQERKEKYNDSKNFTISNIKA